MNKKWHWDSNPVVYDVNEDQPWLVDNNGNRILWGEIHCDLNDNACLIAAAPELLEALEAIIERWDTPLWKDVPHTATYINAARLVVAKAKGKQFPQPSKKTGGECNLQAGEICDILQAYAKDKAER